MPFHRDRAVYSVALDLYGQYPSHSSLSLQQLNQKHNFRSTCTYMYMSLHTFLHHNRSVTLICTESIRYFCWLLHVYIHSIRRSNIFLLELCLTYLSEEWGNGVFTQCSFSYKLQYKNEMQIKSASGRDCMRLNAHLWLHCKCRKLHVGIIHTKFMTTIFSCKLPLHILFPILKMLTSHN